MMPIRIGAKCRLIAMQSATHIVVSGDRQATYDDLVRLLAQSEQHTAQVS